MAKAKVQRKYTAGLSESTAAKRKAEIRKRVAGKKSYKPLAGDAKAKTKPSEHTKKVTRSGVRKEILKTAGEMKGSQDERFIKAVAKVTGVSPAIIRKVFKKGQAAWAVGHRPGATQSQWARARVYSFITGGKTSKTADAALYLQAKKTQRKTGYTI